MSSCGDSERCFLIYVEDVKLYVCSGHPNFTSRDLHKACLHSLRQEGPCVNGYPLENNDDLPPSCYSRKNHNSCSLLAQYGCVNVRDDGKLECNFNTITKDGDILEEKCGDLYDNIWDLQKDIVSHGKKILKDNTITKTAEVIAGIKKKGWFMKVIHSYDAFVESRKNKTVSGLRFETLENQMSLLNLTSADTIANSVFISRILGFDLQLLVQKEKQWHTQNKNKKKQISAKVMSKFVKELMPNAKTRFYCQCDSPFTNTTTKIFCKNNNVETMACDGKHCNLIFQSNDRIFSCSNPSSQNKICKFGYNLCLKCVKQFSMKKLIINGIDLYETQREASTIPPRSTTNDNDKNNQNNNNVNDKNDNGEESDSKCLLSLLFCDYPCTKLCA